MSDLHQIKPRPGPGLVIGIVLLLILAAVVGYGAGVLAGWWSA